MKQATPNRWQCACAKLAVLAAAGPAAAAEAGAGPPVNPATVLELPQVTVIAATPLPGLGLPREAIPASVQTADSADLARQHALDLAAFINDNFSGVNVSETAANPLQLDVSYHGFTASPVLGTPEGLSVYVDGVRVNESFGDTVNWDLIPEAAISTVTLMSGSNPVFGLNTLGGALAVRTKSGHDNPGTELEAEAGSFGRRSLTGTSGGARGGLDWFVTGTYLDEDGWRDASATRAWQAFGKVGWQDERTDLDLSYTYADTRLNGNGPAPASLLGWLREAVYTPGDVTGNHLNFVNLTGTQTLADRLLLSGNAYYRRLTTATVNVNVNDSYLDPAYAGPPLDCAAPASSAAALAWCLPGQNAFANLTQSVWGGALEFTNSRPVLGVASQAIVGADYTRASDTYGQSYQYGSFAPDRSVSAQPGAPNAQPVVALGGDNTILGVYATDTLSPAARLHLTLSARYNRSTETLAGTSVDTDVGDYGSGLGTPRPLGGDESFSRLNPAIGLTVTPAAALTLYADYNQASRAPTVIELGCANPALPCGLPYDFAGDPPLEQVVARTFAAGARSGPGAAALDWSADAFRTTNSNDIQFVATATNAGYFANVGSTRRAGLDLAVGGRAAALRWRLAYSFVDATFESGFAVSAPANSSADAAGNIGVRPGDRIPLVPRNTGRLLLAYQPDARWEVGGSLVAVSGVYLHGNENNANLAGGTNAAGTRISGSGWIPGYAVVNLYGTCRLARRLEVTARVVNLFDRQYATGGLLGSNAFTAQGAFLADPAQWTHENVVTPAPPRAAWAGLRLTFD